MTTHFMPSEPHGECVQRLGVLSARWLLAVLWAISACTTDSAGAKTVDSTQRTEVNEIIVRYEKGAPMQTLGGRPWGAQCVTGKYQERLIRDRGLGARMRVVRVEPRVRARVAEMIAMQIEQCPFIEWAEADVIRFTSAN